MAGAVIRVGPRYVSPLFLGDSRTKPRAKRRAPAAPLPQEALLELDRDLARLARSEGALRLRVGEGLARLEERAWHHELGCSSLSAYVRERCGWRPRVGAEACRLAKRLADLPVLRGCLVSGALGWSMVELCTRHAKPETEEALAAEAAGSTVRAMRERLHDPAPPLSEERASVCVTMSHTDAWLLEHARWLFNLMQPGGTADDFFQALLAEGFCSLAEMVPDGELGEQHSRADELRRAVAAWRAQRNAWCSEAEARVEGRLDLQCEYRGFEHQPLHALTNAHALDAHIRDVCAELAARDLLLGALAERLWKSDGWRRLNYASEKQYARERLGMSLSSVKEKRALAREAKRMPRVAEAIAERRIGFLSAVLVTRIATESTVDAWIERAAERTVKELRQEVDAAALGDRLPPDDATLKAVADQRRETSEAMVTDPEAPFADRVRGVLSQMSVRPAVRSGSVRHRFGVSQETRDVWDDFLECFRAVRGWLPPDASPIRLLCVMFCVEWIHVLATDVKYGHIYSRDGFECRSPLCTRRDVTPHHLVFRSQGGGEEDENIISLCTWCHLFGVHRGLILAAGKVPAVTWELGREPMLRVEGRKKIERVAVAAAA